MTEAPPPPPPIPPRLIAREAALYAGLFATHVERLAKRGSHRSAASVADIAAALQALCEENGGVPTPPMITALATKEITR